MNSKSILTGVIGAIIFSLVFGYTLVFAGTGIFDTHAKITFKLSDSVYLDSINLNKTKLLLKSGSDLSKYKIKSECSIFSKLTYKKGDYYMFDIKFFDNKCDNENFILVDNNNDIKLQFNLKLLTQYDLLSKMLDLPTNELSKLKTALNNKILDFSKYDKYDKNIVENYYTYLANNRELQEAKYNLDVVSNILIKREQKYIVPVPGYKIPTNTIKLPNSGRGYRKDYTDGIHHGWDIDANFGEQVVALDDGIIVRSVSEFDYSDLGRLKKGNKLTKDDLTRNLDILRGKQVWLKTMKGDVIFYSHLNDIFTNVQIGEVVKKGQPLGTVGITGVPDENYIDYHLHFEVQKNPFTEGKNGLYDIDDYLNWNWLFEGQTKDYILENQFNYFEE